MTSTTALTIIETGDYRLSGISQQINAAVHAAEDHAGHAVAAARNAGLLLLEAKSLVPHGQWESWIAANCTVAPRTAQAYMRLATKFTTLPAETATAVADLPLREAMKAITTAPAALKTAGYRPRLSDVTSLRPKFDEAARSLQSAARHIGIKKLSRDRLQSLRAKLQAVQAEVDQMLAEVR